MAINYGLSSQARQTMRSLSLSKGCLLTKPIAIGFFLFFASRKRNCMRRGLLVLLILILHVASVAGQGFFLLIGGGSENDDPQGWNRLPYQWAVDKSQNKRVAFISFNNETSWLPDYFINHLGAAGAKNFRIHTSALANAQVTYDSLMAYDVLFLKGGNQHNYYDTYKGTFTEQALYDKFMQGGVICGTSAGLAVMSGVVFTAANGTVYPDECLENPNNSYVQLADDFLQLMPGYLFDSHFNDRGRLARLAGFLAHWQLNQQETLTGIGLDERTAMVIDTGGLATVYGTGAATLLKPQGPGTFSLAGTRLRADSIHYLQLLHQHSIDLNTGVVTGFANTVTPATLHENRDYTLFLTGDNALAHNQLMLQQLVAEGNPADPVLVVCGNAGSDGVAALAGYLSQLGVTEVPVWQATTDNLYSTPFADDIGRCNKILFMENEWYILDHFLHNGTTGPLLAQRINEYGIIAAFVGSDSRFAGAVVIDNHLMGNGANNGSLMPKPGLALLKTTVVMPEIYLNDNMYVNASGVPYTMMRDSLTNGIMLYKSGFVRYGISANTTWFKAMGNHPVIILRHNGSAGELASATSSSTSTVKRQIAGFDNLWITILTHNDSIMAGDHISPIGIQTKPHTSTEKFTHYFNPSNRTIILHNHTGEMVCALLHDLAGRQLAKRCSAAPEIDLPVNQHNIQLLILTIHTKGTVAPYRKLIPVW
jgi:cyanophycinase